MSDLVVSAWAWALLAGVVFCLVSSEDAAQGRWRIIAAGAVARASLAVDARARGPSLRRAARRPLGGDAAARRAARDRAHRRGVRARLDPGGARGERGSVRGLQLERVCR